MPSKHGALPLVADATRGLERAVGGARRLARAARPGDERADRDGALDASCRRGHRGDATRRCRPTRR